MTKIQTDIAFKDNNTKAMHSNHSNRLRRKRSPPSKSPRSQRDPSRAQHLQQPLEHLTNQSR